MSPLLLIGALGFGVYLLAKKSQQPDCKTLAMRPDLRDAWAAEFNPPLNVFYMGTAEPYPELPYALRGEGTAVAIIASTGEFFVYDVNFHPQPSPNLRDSFCRFAQQEY